MAKALPRGAILLLALFPFLSGAFCPRASLGHLPLAASPVLSSRIGRLATSGPIVRSARILATKLSWQDKFAIQVPEKAWGHERIAIAKTVAIQEEALSPAESPAAKGAGSTVNAARIGQVPFWVAVIGSLAILNMIKQKVAGRRSLVKSSHSLVEAQPVDADGQAHKRPLYAVLIDAENSSWRTLAPILKKIASFGIPSEKRVYGDFTMPSLSEWRAVSREQSFTMMQTVNVIPGKGSSDAALIIDAMDMMYTHPALDGYALVSSDSDFTSLARRLRGAGKHVLGFGSFLTHTQLVSACDRFTYTEDLARIDDRAVKLLARAVHNATQHAIHACGDDGGGWVILGQMRLLMLRLEPDFDLRSSGFKNTKAMALSEPGYFTLREKKSECKIRLTKPGAALVGGRSEAGAAARGGGATPVESAAEQIQGAAPAAEALPTLLWRRLRRAGEHVLGVGSLKTLKQVFSACGRFIYSRNLAGKDGRAFKLLTKAVQHATAELGDDGGWVHLSQMKPRMMRLEPDFDLRASGFKRMKALALSEPRFFEWKTKRGGFFRLANPGAGLVGGRSEAGAVEQGGGAKAEGSAVAKTEGGEAESAASILGRRIKADKHVLAVGSLKTRKKQSSDRFIDTEHLAGKDSSAGNSPTVASLFRPLASSSAFNLLAWAVQNATADSGKDSGKDRGWVSLGKMKLLMLRLQPHFDLRASGFKNMKTLALSEPGYFEWKTKKGGKIRTPNPGAGFVGGRSEAGAAEHSSGAKAEASAVAKTQGAGSAAEALDPLFGRRRKAGKHGLLQTPKPLRSARDRSIYTENVTGQENGTANPAVKLLARAVDHATAEWGDDGGWVHLSQIKSRMLRLEPDFDLRASGFKRMKALALSEPGFFEWKTKEGGKIRSTNPGAASFGGRSEAGAVEQGGGAKAEASAAEQIEGAGSAAEALVLILGHPLRKAGKHGLLPTPKPLRSARDHFIDTENVTGQKNGKANPAVKLLARAVQNATAELGDAGGWVNLGYMKFRMTQLEPGFNLSSSGFKRMKAVALSEPGFFDLRERELGVPGSACMVRLTNRPGVSLRRARRSGVVGR